MTMIDDLIELAHHHGLVRTAALESDGCDAYELATADPVSVRVRPDGRFSCAIAEGGFVSMGQVVDRLLATIEPDGPLAYDRGWSGHRGMLDPSAALRGPEPPIRVHQV